MRIVVVGATGLIGKEIVTALSPIHDVIPVGHTRGDITVDITSRQSIERMFEKTGTFDALISAAGKAVFGPLATLKDEDFTTGLSDKLMGQVNLVRIGLRFMRDNGAFTLTSGVLAREPLPGSSAISLVNAALEGFVAAAALEMPRGIRISIVSPPFAVETLKALGMDESTGLPVRMFAAAYRESVEGRHNGEVLDVRKWKGKR